MDSTSIKEPIKLKPGKFLALLYDGIYLYELFTEQISIHNKEKPYNE